jgi:FMN phosphatase YigB (HAD superfamily)
MNNPSRPRAIVFDFDGTLTRADFDGPFERALFTCLEAREGLALDAPRLDADRAADVVVDGRPVVRAGADPWILGVFRASRALAAEGVGEAAAKAMIARHFRSAIDQEPAPFRDGVRPLFEALRPRDVLCFIVSNSPEAAIRARLAAASVDAGAVSIVGDAQKFSLTDAERPLARGWQSNLGESRRFEGAPRATSLRRGRYLDALARVCESARCTIDELTVVGDVFELDLAIPSLLGARVHAVAHQGFASWERDAVESRIGRAASSIPSIADLFALET